MRCTDEGGEHDAADIDGRDGAFIMGKGTVASACACSFVVTAVATITLGALFDIMWD